MRSFAGLAQLSSQIHKQPSNPQNPKPKINSHKPVRFQHSKLRYDPEAAKLLLPKLLTATWGTQPYDPESGSASNFSGNSDTHRLRLRLSLSLCMYIYIYISLSLTLSLPRSLALSLTSKGFCINPETLNSISAWKQRLH